MRSLRRLDRAQLRLGAHNVVRKAALAAGLDVVRADFNSPIVDSRSLPPGTWERRASLRGLDFGLDRALERLEGELRGLIDEFDAPLRAADPLGLQLENPWYGPMDSQLLYALVRHARPRRVLELGSGFSSLIIDLALERSDGGATHEIVDPKPSPVLGRLRREARIRVQSAAALEDETFARLERGDLLFVDTTHVIRPGGEVVRVVLEALPLLAPGVLVHFHDIFIPFAYPRVLYDRFNVHWQEQYLLQAFLAFNPYFEVEFANHALWRLHRRSVKPLFGGLQEWMQPSAFWIVRRA